jgi:hypothetical protein
VIRHVKHSFNAIRGLDPVEDYRAIYGNLIFVDAAGTMTAGLNMAFYRSFAAPNVARLLATTRVAIDEPAARAVDTGILVWEMVMHGFEHERGRAALSRMNRIHSVFEISTEDFLYVLSTLVVVPIGFMDRYGWRRAFPQERTASAEFYRELGRRMALGEIPASFGEFEAYMNRYEREHFVYTDQARELLLATGSLMEHRFPKPLRRAVALLTSTLMDRRMRAAGGVRNPPPGLTALVRMVARPASRLARWRNPHPTHRFPNGVVAPMPTYPDGYRIDQVGHHPAD